MPSIALPPNVTFPHDAYCSTQPIIAWCLNHYVYSGTHYTWCSRYFFPYKAKNPKSSSPYQIFQDLYQPSYDGDQWDSFIRQKRLNLRVGVDKIVQPGASTHPFAHRYKDLCDICDRIDASFFWPIIYLINQAAVTSRGQSLNSALLGSDERLVPNLREDEFILILHDLDRQSPLASDFVNLINNGYSQNDAIDQLLKRC